MTQKQFVSETINLDQRKLSVVVKEEYVQELKRRLLDVVPHKSIYNTTRLFVFLSWLNNNGLNHVRKEDLAEMTFSKHEDRLNKAIEALSSIHILEVEKRFNVSTQRTFYTYFTLPFEYDIPETETTRAFDYSLPEYMVYSFRTLGFTFTSYSSSNQHEAKTETNILYANEESTSSPAEITTSCEAVDFESSFVHWYSELVILKHYGKPGHFSEKDGRFYHVFHELPKEERGKSILWEREGIVEVWDAHSAFFTTFAYYLKYHKEYETEDKREAFVMEADTMLDYTLKDELYTAVSRYCIKYNYNSWGTTRDSAKNLCQIYKSSSRRTLFRKTDGQLKNCWWAQRLKGVDEFFKANFPNIRNMFLDYPRHLEDDKDHRVLTIDPITHTPTWGYKKKSVSNIQNDIMPYEFQLFSLGVCRDLYEQFGIKSITVHDAIYMKVSDAQKNVDIDSLLRKRLGKTTLQSAPLF